MAQFRVLYLEHDPAKDKMKTAIEENIKGVAVDLLDNLYNDFDSLPKSLDNNYYDLIITDVCFLPRGMEHETDKTQPKNLLHNILETVNKHKGSRIPVLVVTQFTDETFDEVKKYNEEYGTKTYLFDKDMLTQRMLVWWVETIKLSIDQRRPEHALVKRLNELIRNDPSFHPAS